MKIKNFKTLVYEFPLKEKVVTSFGEMDSRPALILEVKTTDNIKGYGEIWCNWPIKSAYYKVNLVHKVFLEKPILKVGQTVNLKTTSIF